MATWLFNFPMPPSANSRLTLGAGRFVKSKSHRVFRDLCHLWALQNRSDFEPIRDELIMLTRQMKEKHGFAAFRVDVYFAFTDSSIKTADTDNRMKALYDGLAAILEIDDRHFYAGNCEKVMTTSKEQECSVIRIEPMRPRTLTEIRALARAEHRTPAS